MKLLRKTPIAILIMAASILLSTLLGGRGSLIKARREVEALFFSAERDGYSIQGELETIGATAVNFKTIASRYIDASDPMITSLTAARQALTEAKTPSEKCDAAKVLFDSVTLLYDFLVPASMNIADRGFRESLYSDIKSAMTNIAESSYNSSAREFNSALTAFPTAQLASVAGIEPVELYE